MTDTARFDAARAWLAQSETEILALLREIVNIDSGTPDAQGVDAVGTRIAAFLSAQGLAPERPEIEGTAARPVRLRLSQGGNQPGAMLMGHMDTVFPTGDAARRPFTIRDGRAYGPGVADMKAGVVLAAFAAAAVGKFALPVNLSLLLTIDEEIGSPRSAEMIRAEARRNGFALNLEPGRVSGNFVTGRRGGAFYRLRLTGRASHAGLNPKDGRSAIHEMAFKVARWLEIPAELPGTSLNVGRIQGGTTVNTVAADCMAEIDLRFGDQAQLERADALIRHIAQDHQIADITAELELMGQFLPLNETAASTALARRYQEAAALNGLQLEGEFTPSCADSGLTAAEGLPTLCALGPVGGAVHSPEEYLELKTLMPRLLSLFDVLTRPGL